ncbi:MAG: hypothetical protein CME25_20715 [Gemmatimonadetes bacterium]|nr:hypothetical protein [Gemmatimonadota bacterium]
MFPVLRSIRSDETSEDLERCNERGAYVVEVHLQTQDVNPTDERLRPFYRRVAELGTILMVYTGPEHSSEVTGHALTDPAGLLPALDEGCTVVAAHSGMGSDLDP